MLRKLKNSTFFQYTFLESVALTIIFGPQIFGDKYLLYKDIGNDSYYQVYAYLVEINRLFRETHEWPLWSFNFGVGQEIPASYYFNFFNWPLFVIPSEYIPKAMTWMELLKIYFTGLLFLKYLKGQKFRGFLCIFGAISLSISGFILQYASFYTYITFDAFLFVLWLYGLQLFQKGRISVISIAVALTLSHQPILFFIFLVFTLFYGLRKPETFDLKRALKVVVLGFGSGAYFLKSNLSAYRQSTRDGLFEDSNPYLIDIIQPSSLVDLKTSFLRFFGNNLEGIGDFYSGAMIYPEAPAFFVGLLPLLFILPIIRNHKYLAVGVILVLFFPFLRNSFWLLKGDYFRILGFILSVLLIEGFIEFVNSQNQNTKKKLDSFLTPMLTVLLGLGLLFTANTTNNNQTLFTTITLILLTLIYWFWARLKNSTLLISLFIIALIHQVVDGYQTINKRNRVSKADFKKSTGFNDCSKAAINWIKIRDSTFYRIEKDFTSGNARVNSINDALIQDFHGTRLYSSFNNQNYIEYLKYAGQLPINSEKDARWIIGFTNRFELLNNLSVKYLVSKGLFDWTQVGYSPVKKIDDCQIYQNRHSWSFGTVNNSVISEADYLKQDSLTQKNILQNYVILSNADVNFLAKQFELARQLTNTGKQDSEIAISSYSNTLITGSISLSQPSLLYFTIPFDSQWKFISGKNEIQKMKANFGMTAISLPPGDHQLTIRYDDKIALLFICLSSIFSFLLLIQFYTEIRS